MTVRHTYLRVLLLTVLGVLIGLTGFLMWEDYRSSREITEASVPTVLSPVSVAVTAIADRTPVPIPTSAPTSVPYTAPEVSVTIVDVPEDLIEGGQATFTWDVGGSARNIRTTAVYFGPVANPGPLATTVRPEDTSYGAAVTDFLSGSYRIPLRFVGSVRIPAAGTYFARGYAYIDGKHIWSPERIFTAAQAPRHDVHVISYPVTTERGVAVPFTWDVTGPSAVSGFSAIVGGKTSFPGILDQATDIPKTPYAVLTEDFTGGSYQVPLRFVGNARFEEEGTYYFRALVFVNGKNVWSDEFSLTVR